MGRKWRRTLDVLYLIGVTMLVLAAFFAVGVGEHTGPHEGLLKILSVASLAAALGAITVASRSRPAAAALFAVQVGLLYAVSKVDTGRGGIRVAPFVIVVAVAVEIVGAVAITLRRSSERRRTVASTPRTP